MKGAIMPDTIFIFALALIIFGPKKLPEIGRQLGKLVGEFRRASNEFKMQIEEELRAADQNDRQKQLAVDAIAPPAATLETRELPAPLTVKPPSTGEIESTESPYRPYRSEEIEAAQNYSGEEGAYDREYEAYGRVEEPYGQEAYGQIEGAYEPGAYGQTEEAYGQDPYGQIEEIRDERAGEQETPPPQPDAPAASEIPATRDDGAAGALEEQPTNHHG